MMYDLVIVSTITYQWSWFVILAVLMLSFEQIGDLRRGDILITHATDIGWSPYFPLLTGIVTELGGLISHGTL